MLFNKWLGRGEASPSRGFTLIEVLIASGIFIIIMTLVLITVTGAFKSLRQAENFLIKEQRQRACLLRLSKEISSVTRVDFPSLRFKGDEKSFFFVFAKEDNLVEAGYVYNADTLTLEHYHQEPTDYDFNTAVNKDACLSGLAECKFSYNDGPTWQPLWQETNERFPLAIKMNFKLSGEEKEKEFIVNIPIGP